MSEEKPKPKRKAITDKMKWQCLLYRSPAVCSICNTSIGPLSVIEWDHVWEVSDEGPHTYQNLRPLHKDCHKKKSGVSTTHRAHIKRLAKGKKKSKHPMRATGRKMQSRPFPSKRPRVP